MTFRSLLAAATVAAFAVPAHAGELTRASVYGDFEWKSTECVRPTRPFLRRDDPLRQQAMAAYARQAASFIDCMKREAQRDFDRTQLDMQKGLERSLQAEVDRVNDEMERLVRESR